MERGKVSLKYPIPDGKGGELKELEFKGLKLKHRNIFPIEVQKGERELSDEEMIPILAKVFNLPLESIEELDMEDLPNVVERFKSFFGDSQST
jgi:hypothetical protein